MCRFRGILLGVGMLMDGIRSGIGRFQTEPLRIDFDQRKHVFPHRGYRVLPGHLITSI